MKKLLSVICALAIVFAGCEPNAPATSNKVVTGAAKDVTTTSAVLYGEVNVDISQYDDVEFGIMLSESLEDLNNRDGEMYKAKVLMGKEFKLELTNLSPETEYYYCAWLFLNNTQYEFGEIKKFTTGDHEYVDLGLSVKWATCNVGATKPEDYGDYFAWGETEPKTTYTWSTYKYGNELTLTKYCTSSDYGTVDNKTVLDKEDDAAAVNWGGAWRMPTKAEQDELCQQCTWTWITKNAVMGYQVTGPNGKSIFLPAAGSRHKSTLYGAGSYGYYWSSSLDMYLPGYAWFVSIKSSNVEGCNGDDDRTYGFSVRPVCQ